MIFGAGAVEDVLRAFAAWAPTMPEEITTSVDLLRLPPSDDVPPPLRGVVSLALRFGSTGSAEQGEALLAPMRKVAVPLDVVELRLMGGALGRPRVSRTRWPDATVRTRCP